MYKRQSKVRVACETLATTNRVVIAGEVRTSLDEKAMKSKVKSAARKAIKAIGYEQDGFHWKTAKIDVLLHSQSADIAQGVDNAADKQGDEGAGDQGIMFGYALSLIHILENGRNGRNGPFRSFSACSLQSRAFLALVLETG